MKMKNMSCIVPFMRALEQACEVNASFGNYTENEQLVFLFSTVDLTRSLAKTCFQILHRRAIIIHIILYDYYMHLIPY